MNILDPLRWKIHEQLVTGQPNPLNLARLRWGTQRDIAMLQSEISRLPPSQNNFFCIDLTPFERIGNPAALVRVARLHPRCRPVILTIGDSVLQQFKQLPDSEKETVEFARYHANGAFDRVIAGTKLNPVSAGILERYKSLSDLRSVVAEQRLTELLFGDNCLDLPGPGKPDRYTKVCGQWYRKMPNGMLVSCYLNLKEIGKSPEELTALAYEIILPASGYFRRDRDELAQFAAFVVPNNTALLLTSPVQAILEKPVICIDKLGPIPSITQQDKRTLELICGRDVILVEEVIATGNEVDRTMLFLSNAKARVQRVIALYNLEVGRPLLIEQEQIISLSKPRRELRYVYRSDF